MQNLPPEMLAAAMQGGPGAAGGPLPPAPPPPGGPAPAGPPGGPPPMDPAGMGAAGMASAIPTPMTPDQGKIVLQQLGIIETAIPTVLQAIAAVMGGLAAGGPPPGGPPPGGPPMGPPPGGPGGAPPLPMM